METAEYRDRVNREVHARIWERPGVQFLRGDLTLATCGPEAGFGRFRGQSGLSSDGAATVSVTARLLRPAGHSVLRYRRRYGSNRNTEPPHNLCRLI